MPTDIKMSAAVFADAERLFQRDPNAAFRRMRDLWLDGRASAAGAPAGSRQRLFLLSAQARRQGRPLPALSRLQAAAGTSRDQAWMRYFTGELLLTYLQLHAEADRELRGVIRDCPWLWQARCLRAEAFLALGRPAQAFGLLAGPDVPDADLGSFLAWRGAMRLWTGDYAAAVADLDQAVLHRSPDAHCWRGGAQVRLGRWAAALQDLDRAVELDGGDAEALIWRGELKRLMGRARESARDLDAAVAAKGGSVWVTLNRSLLHLDRGDPAGARREFALLGPFWTDVFSSRCRPSGATVAGKMASLLRGALELGRGCRREDAHLHACWMRAAGIEVPAHPAAALARGASPGGAGRAFRGAVLAAIAAAAALASPADCAPRVSVGMHPVVELAEMAQLLGAGRHRFDGFVARRRGCIAAAAAGVQGLKGHPAVALTAELDEGGLSYDLRNNVLLRLTDPPGLRPRVPLSDWWAEKAGGAARLDAWIEALSDLSARPAFTAYYAALQSCLAAPLKALQQDVDTRDYAGKLERYTGIAYDGTYRIVASPYFLPGGSVNSVVEQEDGSLALFTIHGPVEDDASGVRFGTAELSGTLWHELSHGDLDPLAWIHHDQIARSEPLMKKLPFSCYGDWDQCVIEHLVRAVKNRLIALHEGGAAAAADLRAEEKEGFLYLRPLVERLGEYEEDRARYPTLASFYPRWLAVLDDAAAGAAAANKGVAGAEPQVGPSWLSLATRSLGTEGRRRRALRYLDLLIARDPQPLYLKKRALLRHLAGAQEGALADADRLLRGAEDDLEAAFVRGLALESMGRRREAGQAFASAASLCRDRAAASAACGDPRLLGPARGEPGR